MKKLQNDERPSYFRWLLGLSKFINSDGRRVYYAPGGTSAYEQSKTSLPSQQARKEKLVVKASKASQKASPTENFKEAIETKRGGLIELPLEDLEISEYNARHAFIDEGHAQELAALIGEYGFRKERAIQVNVIRDAQGKALRYRVVAGAHRFFGAKLSKLSKIHCHLYYDLTEEEECFLDQLDNKIDEKRKCVHFLDDAEHCGYLEKVKSWSQRKIAQVRGVSQRTITWKLKIANLPEQVKEVIRGDDPGHHLVEKYFRAICKLKSSGHMMLICKEIIDRGRAAEAEERDERGVLFSSMKQKEVFSRVAELLELEKQEEVSPKLSEEIGAEDFIPSEDAASYEPIVSNPPSVHHGGHSKQTPSESPPKEPERVPDNDEEILAKLRKERLNEQKAMGPVGVPSKENSTEAMKFDIVPRWLRRSRLRKDLGADWDLFDVLMEFGMRYRRRNQSVSSQDLFFIEGREKTPEGSYLYLAELCNVTQVTLKRKLRRLVQKGYIQMVPANVQGYPHFQICWEKLKEEYDASAWSIHFEEGGLEDIPPNFSGTIEPTPVHEIWVREGTVCKGIDHAVSETMRVLKKLGAKPKFVRKLLRENYLGTLRHILSRLPALIESHQQKTGASVDEPLDFFLACLKEATRESQLG